MTLQSFVGLAKDDSEGGVNEDEKARDSQLRPNFALISATHAATIGTMNVSHCSWQDKCSLGLIDKILTSVPTY